MGRAPDRLVVAASTAVAEAVTTRLIVKPARLVLVLALVVALVLALVRAPGSTAAVVACDTCGDPLADAAHVLAAGPE